MTPDAVTLKGRRFPRHKESGLILVSVYAILSFLLVLGGGLLSFALVESRSAVSSFVSLQAFYLAEAGIDQAISQLRLNSDWSGSSPVPLGSGTYSSTVTTPGIENPNRRRITAQGNSNLLSGPITRSVETLVDLDTDNSLPRGIFADKDITINGNVRVDSYDSRLGPPPNAGGTASGNAVIGSNSTSTNPPTIRINGGSTFVGGDVLAGPGASSDAIDIGNSTVTGRVGAAEHYTSLPPVAESLKDAKELHVGGSDTVTLPGGSHHFSRIRVDGGGQLKFTGPAVVYAGEVKISGNSISTAQNLPENLLINVVGNSQVTLLGTSDFYGVIYAPGSDVSVKGDVEVYGAIVGRRISGIRGNVEVWFDEALLNGSSPTGNQVLALAWQDLS